MTSNTSPNKTDLAVSIAKGLFGAIPVVGPLAEEVVGTLIPNQRMDRLAKFLRILDEKVETMNQELLKSRFLVPDFVDLFEEGLYRAARAATDERLEYIASLLKNGLTEEHVNYAQYKHILSLLSEMNDVEVLILQAYNVGWVGEFVEKHLSTLRPEPATFISPPEVVDNSIIYASYENHLVRLNLLHPGFSYRQGELPEFDRETGTIKSSGLSITGLGRLLLRSIDYKDDEQIPS